MFQRQYKISGFKREMNFSKWTFIFFVRIDFHEQQYLLQFLVLFFAFSRGFCSQKFLPAKFPYL